MTRIPHSMIDKRVECGDNQQKCPLITSTSDHCKIYCRSGQFTPCKYTEYSDKTSTADKTKSTHFQFAGWFKLSTMDKLATPTMDLASNRLVQVTDLASWSD
uniref:Uncharacterized protein n=1 Tax=Ascaris lumbricoides TaxID=6252 RepID=A0A0M3I3G3_ASCLU